MSCRLAGLSPSAYHETRAEGWHVNHKKIQCLRDQDGLQVPVRSRRKSIGTSTTRAIAATAPNMVGTADFRSDSDESGKPIKICTFVDEPPPSATYRAGPTRECLGGMVERRITADDVTTQLDQLAAQREYPAVLRSDNRPEFLSHALATWADQNTGLSYIPLRHLWRNGYVESFNSRIRDERLNLDSFYSLLDAHVVIRDWKCEYNTTRRHSALGYIASIEYARNCTHHKENDNPHSSWP